MASRRKAREFALQMLFQADLAQTPAEEIQGLFWKLNRTDSGTREFAEKLFAGFREHRQEVDELISRHAHRWKLERIAGVDRNVLRVATTELLWGETPAPVIIDEAIEVARKYGGGESGEFVNGVLDSIRRELQEESETPAKESKS